MTIVNFISTSTKKTTEKTESSSSRTVRFVAPQDDALLRCRRVCHCFHSIAVSTKKIWRHYGIVNLYSTLLVVKMTNFDCDAWSCDPDGNLCVAI